MKLQVTQCAHREAYRQSNDDFPAKLYPRLPIISCFICRLLKRFLFIFLLIEKHLCNREMFSISVQFRHHKKGFGGLTLESGNVSMNPEADRFLNTFLSICANIPRRTVRP